MFYIQNDQRSDSVLVGHCMFQMPLGYFLKFQKNIVLMLHVPCKFIYNLEY